MQYDAAGNLTNDGYQSYQYDAVGRQSYASGTDLTQSYDGDGLRVAKTENAQTTYYLRSSVLGGQVVAEINSSGGWQRGYVYLGSQLLAIQSGGVHFVHQDPVAKSQRVTDVYGNVESFIELDPWGGETSRSANSALQPRVFTSYVRDGNGSDDAMMRRYDSRWNRFSQPDSYGGSYSLTNPQSFNRYSYTQSDPVNFVDPSGLERSICGYFNNGESSGWVCVETWEWYRWGGYNPPERPIPNEPTNPGAPPQNSKILVSDAEKEAYRRRIEEMLKNKNCADYIQQLLNEVKTQSGRSFGDILTTFDAIRFYWANTGGVYGGGAYWEGMGTVRAADIMNTINTEKMGGSRANQMDRRAFLISQTTQSFLGETLHHVSQGGRMYGDGEMANALNAILVRQGLDTPKKFSDLTMKDVDNASRYWHPKVWAACPAPRK